MLMEKNLVESVLSDSTKELFNNSDYESLKKIADTLQADLNDVINEINKTANQHQGELKPEIDKTERFINKIQSLKDQINLIKFDLDEQENLLKNASEIDEYKKLIDHIEVINKIILAIKSLEQFESHLNEFKLAIDNKNYSDCNECLMHLHKINNECEFFSKKYEINSKDLMSEGLIEHSRNESHEILIVKELKEDFTVQRERLWYELDQEWDNLLSMSSKENDFRLTICTDVTQSFFNNLTQFSKFKVPNTKRDESMTTKEKSPNYESFIFLSRMKKFSKEFLKVCQKYILNEAAILDEQSNLYKVKINTSDNRNNLSELTFVLVDLDEFLDNDDNAMQRASNMLQFKLEQIFSLLNFLYENFFKLEISNEKLVSSSSKSKATNKEKYSPKLMTIFSEIVLKDFVKLIYEQLIISIIPLKNYDCDMESKICENVKQFELDLRKIEFLGTEKGSFNEFEAFINNVEELYVRKKCKNIMETGRELMKNHDLLFDTFQIQEKNFCLDKIKNSNISNKKFMLLFNKLLKLDEANSKATKLDELNLLVMPMCSVSKISQKIVELVYETLNEALKMTEKSNNIKNISLLCLAARNLFDLYSAVVPTHHSESLENLPILSAIIYNDFKYLAFNCLTITHQYKKLFLNLKRNTSKNKSQKLALIDIDEIIYNFSCLDLIPKLCLIGHEILIKQFQKQQNNLIQYLNEDTNGIKDISENNNYDLFKRALQKCSIQLNHLASLWFDILSKLDYFRIFGQFLDLICNDLIKSVLHLEDISSDDASYLHSAFSLLNQTVFDLISKHERSDDNSIKKEQQTELANLSYMNNLVDLIANKYIKSWSRFKYLLILLKANLVEIVDLWSDSKGPLAENYDSEEIRHLIKALFMNTDRRSDALSKIK